MTKTHKNIQTSSEEKLLEEEKSQQKEVSDSIALDENIKEGFEEMNKPYIEESWEEKRFSFVKDENDGMDVVEDDLEDIRETISSNENEMEIDEVNQYKEVDMSVTEEEIKTRTKLQDERVLLKQTKVMI